MIWEEANIAFIGQKLNLMGLIHVVLDRRMELNFRSIECVWETKNVEKSEESAVLFEESEMVYRKITILRLALWLGSVVLHDLCFYFETRKQCNFINYPLLRDGLLHCPQVVYRPIPLFASLITIAVLILVMQISTWSTKISDWVW